MSDVTATSGPRPGTPPARRRSTAMWAVFLGVLLATGTAVLVDARAGSLALAGVLVLAGAARAVIPGPGPVGITVRSRGFDVLVFWTLGGAIAALAVVAPQV